MLLSRRDELNNLEINQIERFEEEYLNVLDGQYAFLSKLKNSKKLNAEELLGFYSVSRVIMKQRLNI